MAIENGTWWYYGSVELGIWAKKAGTWVKITTIWAQVQEYYNSGGYRTLAWAAQEAIDLGPGVEAFGVTLDQVFGGDAGALTDFVSATWTATSTSGERTATPGGQKSTVVVLPQ